MCSRISAMACSNSSIASSALRPSQGEAAACEVLPKNSTSVAVSASRLPLTISFLSPGCQERTTSVFLKAPAISMKVLPMRISSAGEPKIWMVPGSFFAIRSRFAATAAATAAVPSRLWPQPCPGAPFTSGSLRASPPCWESSGSASYSARIPTTGSPNPAVATKAVGSFPTPRCTWKPSFSSRSSKSAADFFSCSAVSENSQSCLETCSQRVRVWSR